VAGQPIFAVLANARTRSTRGDFDLGMPQRVAQMVEYVFDARGHRWRFTGPSRAAYNTFYVYDSRHKPLPMALAVMALSDREVVA
jgi:hypothetical protein